MKYNILVLQIIFSIFFSEYLWELKTFPKFTLSSSIDHELYLVGNLFLFLIIFRITKTTTEKIYENSKIYHKRDFH